MPFILPAPTSDTNTDAKVVPVWKNFLAIAAYLNSLQLSNPFNIITTTGAGTITSPATVGTATIIAIGAGGSTPNASTTNAVSGAGSGEFVRATIPVLPNTVYNLFVGAAVANSAGQATWFNATAVLNAAGGLAGVANGSGGKGGGRAAPNGGATGNPGGAGLAAVSEGLNAESGASGGGPGTGGGANTGGVGGPNEEFLGGAAGSGTGVTTPGGGGGAASPFGAGGAAGNAVNGGTGNPGQSPAATAYGAGAGGPGAGTVAGGAGALGMQGVLMIQWN